MHKSFLKSVIGAALVGLSTAHAVPMTEPANKARVEIQSDRSYNLAPQEFDAYKGTYRLETGAAMKVWRQGNRLFVQVGDQLAQQLFAREPGVFDSRNGATLRFVDDGPGAVAVTEYHHLLVAMR